MGKKSSKKKAAAIAATSPDKMVESALRKVMTKMYRRGYDGGITAKRVQELVDGDITLMQSLDYVNYAALQEAETKGEFARFEPRQHYFEAAMEALEILHGDAAFLTILESQQENQTQVHETPTPKVKMHIEKEGKLQRIPATSATKRKAQTMIESGVSDSESAKPELRGHSVLEEIDKAGGTTLMERAKQKAEEELAAEFNYALLCTQGRKLYKMVLIDKTKRLHNKMKHRAKKRVSQPSN